MEPAQAFNLVSTLAVVAGLIFAGWQVNLLRQQHKRESMMQLVQSFRSPEFAEGIRLVCELPDSLPKADIDARLGDRARLVWLVMLSLEGVGLLVSRKDVALGFVQEFWSGPTLVSWRKLERYVRDIRAELKMETPMEYFQWLAEQLERRPRIEPAHVRLKDWIE